MAAPPFSESELRFLRALRRRKVRFMVVGLSAAALQGAPVVVGQLLRTRCRRVGVGDRPGCRFNVPQVAEAHDKRGDEDDG